MDSIIEVSELVKTFGDIRAVNRITFSVPKGSVFGFLGPNGAGKTTTIKMLTTLLHPTSGSIRVNKADPVTDRNAVRHSFGIVFQDPSLDDELTAFENLELHGALYHVPKALRRERIKELLSFVDLLDRQDDLVKHFSGGMKRRLEIARGLVHHPKVLFLDEPTVGLDPHTRNHIWSYIKDLSQKEGMTVFFTTHYMEEADRSADRIAVIDHGKIVAQGTPAAIKEETRAATLEDAFLSLTGHAIRDEGASAMDQLRSARRMWRR